MTVVSFSGAWFVVGADGRVLAGPFKTNAEAWRALDRINGQPVSRSEKTSEYLWNKETR